MQEIDLAATRLSSRNMASRIVLASSRRTKDLDGKPFLRRTVAITENSRKPFEGQAERTGNRRRGQRQDVDFGAQRFQRFLLPDAETMLFIDDDQT